MTTRLEFYDPLYETITFERGLPSSRGFLRPIKEDPLNPVEIIQTADFARLAFLRQAGLAWLVFPSATHTRFGHSLGCWWLGRIAESLIKVRGVLNMSDEVRSLHKWLLETRLREEFYLGLLFHDVGHGPLSHVLERNPEFVAGLRTAGVPEEESDHEHRGASLLEGKGPLADIWREIAPARYGSECKLLCSSVAAIAESSEEVCIPAILYFITSDKKFLHHCRHPHREFLGIVHELVSGLLDLDRLDHYARDSYFSGLRQVSINVRGFLNNLCLSYDSGSKGKAIGPVQLSLTRDGSSHAASLLFGKRQLVTTMFRNPRTIALHSMANWALSAFMESLASTAKARAALEISLMEDDQFLEMISRSSHNGCRYLSQRIRALQPYTFVGRWPNDTGHRPNRLKAAISDYVGGVNHDVPPKVLVHYDDGFWKRGERSEAKDWLDSGSLILEESGKCLTDHPDQRDSFMHLQNAERAKYMWVFSRDAEDQSEIWGEVGEIMGRSAPTRF